MNKEILEKREEFRLSIRAVQKNDIFEKQRGIILQYKLTREFYNKYQSLIENGVFAGFLLKDIMIELKKCSSRDFSLLCETTAQILIKNVEMITLFEKGIQYLQDNVDIFDLILPELSSKTKTKLAIPEYLNYFYNQMLEKKGLSIHYYSKIFNMLEELTFFMSTESQSKIGIYSQVKEKVIKNRHGARDDKQMMLLLITLMHTKRTQLNVDSQIHLIHYARNLYRHLKNRRCNDHTTSLKKNLLFFISLVISYQKQDCQIFNYVVEENKRRPATILLKLLLFQSQMEWWITIKEVDDVVKYIIRSNLGTSDFKQVLKLFHALICNDQSPQKWSIPYIYETYFQHKMETMLQKQIISPLGDLLVSFTVHKNIFSRNNLSDIAIKCLQLGKFELSTKKKCSLAKQLISIGKISENELRSYFDDREQMKYLSILEHTQDIGEYHDFDDIQEFEGYEEDSQEEDMFY